jgi:sugar phosphate isomerase/epimerase
MSTDRRHFLKLMGGLAVGATGINSLSAFGIAAAPGPYFFEISLAQWSLHKALFAKKINNLDFAGIARKEYGIGVVEYVNQFFKDKARDTAYLNEMLQRCKDHDVKNHLIMIDGEGDLGNLNDSERKKAVENHYPWVDAAKYLGCITIRVNAAGTGKPEEVAKAAVDGLSRLGEYGAKQGINVIVENHGGYSSNGEWLMGVMKQIGQKNVGTLPDFGNFCLNRKPNDWVNCLESYDRYKGTAEMMPFAKGVSAKSNNFDAAGNETETDYMRIMKIVKDAGYRGYVGIEFEGDSMSEDEGIRKTKALLEKIGAVLGV